MKPVVHAEQDKMLGASTKDARSKTSRSSRSVDRERRHIKRATKQEFRLNLKAGHYQRLLP